MTLLTYPQILRFQELEPHIRVLRAEKGDSLTIEQGLIISEFTNLVNELDLMGIRLEEYSEYL